MINKDYNGGDYTIAIKDERYEYQYFSKNNMLFLFYMVDKVKSILKKSWGYNRKLLNYINQINNICYMTIKYLMVFNLGKLTFFNFIKNKINPNDVSYLSQMKSNHF